MYSPVSQLQMHAVGLCQGYPLQAGYPGNGKNMLPGVAQGHGQKMVKTMVSGCAWRGIQNMVFKWCLYGPCLGRDHIFSTFSPCSEYPSRHTPRPLFSPFCDHVLEPPPEAYFYHFLDFPGYPTCRGYPQHKHELSNFCRLLIFIANT